MKQFGSRLSVKMEIVLYIVWAFVSILWTITAFQVRAALLALSLLLIQTPALLPYGWSTSTLHGLNRLFVLIIGALWLGLIIFSEDYLREALEEQIFLPKLKRLLLMIAATYLISGGLSYLSGFFLQS